MPDWLTKLLAAVLGSFFDKLFGNVRQEIDARQARADQQAIGQDDQKITDLVATVDAERRMDQAGSEPKGPSATRKMLDEGRF